MGVSMSSKVALVTGGNRGIGLEVARQLARQQVRVLLGCRHISKGQMAVDSLTQEGLSVFLLPLDLNDPIFIRRAVSDGIQKFGHIDILINNAAVLHEGLLGFESKLTDISGDTLIQTLITNVVGPYRLIQEVLPIMQQRNYGRIVNMSSRAGQVQTMDRGFPAYRVSKAALNALTLIAAAECSNKNIKINAASPGWVRTELGGPDADYSAEEGADTPVWLAMLPDDGPTGKFFEGGQEIPW